MQVPLVISIPPESADLPPIGDDEKTCSPCRLAGRDCVRGYNVRFRNLVCPAKESTRSDYGKYEFFFDSNQEWPKLEKPGKLLIDFLQWTDQVFQRNLWTMIMSLFP